MNREVQVLTEQIDVLREAQALLAAKGLPRAAEVIGTVIVDKYMALGWAKNPPQPGRFTSQVMQNPPKHPQGNT